MTPQRGIRGDRVSEKQPEALRLACIFEDSAEAMGSTSDDYFYKAAAELRRQHALLEEMAGAMDYVVRDLEVRSQWKEGVDKGVVDIGDGAYQQAKAALAKWEASK
jgi:hypothetical protein